MGASIFHLSSFIFSSPFAFHALSATFKNFSISSGGTVYYSSAANLISGFHIYSGCKVSGAKLNLSARDTVVHSGGMLYFVYGGSASNLTVESGAYVGGLFTNAFRLVGGNWQIESGATIVNGNQVRSDVFTDARGAIHNAAIAGAAYFSGVLPVDAKVSCRLLYMSNGTTVSGGIAGTGGFAIQSGYLYNGNVYNTGKIWTQATNAKISLCGAETSIRKGNWYHINCNNTTVQDTDLYAKTACFTVSRSPTTPSASRAASMSAPSRSMPAARRTTTIPPFCEAV